MKFTRSGLSFYGIIVTAHLVIDGRTRMAIMLVSRSSKNTKRNYTVTRLRMDVEKCKRVPVDRSRRYLHFARPRPITRELSLGYAPPSTCAKRYIQRSHWFYRVPNTDGHQVRRVDPTLVAGLCWRHTLAPPSPSPADVTRSACYMGFRRRLKPAQ